MEKDFPCDKLLSHSESQKPLCQTTLQEEVQKGMEEHRLFFQILNKLKSGSHAKTLAEMGFPLNKEYVDIVVKGYLKQIGRPNLFREDGIPGYSWWKGFLRRHLQLSKRKPQHLSKKRAESNDRYPDVLDKCFAKLADLLKHPT